MLICLPGDSRADRTPERHLRGVLGFRKEAKKEASNESAKGEKVVHQIKIEGASPKHLHKVRAVGWIQNKDHSSTASPAPAL